MQVRRQTGNIKIRSAVFLLYRKVRLSPNFLMKIAHTKVGMEDIKPGDVVQKNVGN